MEINKSSSTPLYIQISNLIKNRINAGLYVTNQLLPSEMDIQKQYSISRVTARKAYNLLMEGGIIRAVRGKGTYVNDLREKDWTWMRHFTKEVKSQGHEPSSKMLSFREILANEEVASILELPVLAPIYYLKRLRCIDNVPVWLTRTYIPVKAVEGLSKEYFSEKGSAQSIFFVLETDFGIEFAYDSVIDYQADVPDKDLEILGIDRNKPIEKTAYVSKNANRIPIVYEKTIFEQTIVKNPSNN